MTTGQEPFPTDLCRQIGIMAGKFENNVEERKDEDWYRKKVYIYATALAQYFRFDSKTKTSPKFYVQDDPKYIWASPSTYPNYLAKDSFDSRAVGLSFDSNWYDYVFDGHVQIRTRTGSTSPTPISAAVPSPTVSFRKRPCAARRRISPISPPGRTRTRMETGARTS